MGTKKKPTAAEVNLKLGTVKLYLEQLERENFSLDDLTYDDYGEAIDLLKSIMHRAEYLLYV